MPRYAVVGRGTRAEVEAFLPENYEIVHWSSEPDGKGKAVIAGDDTAGWTLDEYVRPRLASGLMTCREYPTYGDANEACVAAMN